MLIQSDDTKAHGLFWMTDEKIAETVATITAGGGTISKDLFTTRDPGRGLRRQEHHLLTIS